MIRMSEKNLSKYVQRRKIGTENNARIWQTFSDVNEIQDLRLNSNPASKVGSEHGSIEFTREDIEDLLSEKMKYKKNEESGSGAASVVLRHQLSSVSFIEFIASAGLSALIGIQTTRDLSSHSAATMAIAMSLRDGFINLSNNWIRQFSKTSSGNICYLYLFSWLVVFFSLFHIY